MFYDTFKRLCEKKGVSCNKAAIEIGLSNATPTKWKKTSAIPSGETLRKIADYFGVSVDSLIGLRYDLPDEMSDDEEFEVYHPDYCMAANDLGLSVDTAMPIYAELGFSYDFAPNYERSAEAIEKYFIEHAKTVQTEKAPANGEGLTDEERRFIECYRSLPSEVRAAVDKIVLE